MFVIINRVENDRFEVTFFHPDNKVGVFGGYYESFSNAENAGNLIIENWPNISLDQIYFPIPF